MRFMMIVKSVEKSGPPPKALMDAIDKLAEESKRDNTMVIAGGLAPVAASTHVRVGDGKLTTTDGPFTEAKEAIVGYALVNVDSKEQAIELSKRFWKIVGDGSGIIQRLYDPNEIPGA